MSQSFLTKSSASKALDGKYFAKYAKPTYDNGYSVISLRPGQKIPNTDIGWREACWSRFSDEWVQQQAGTTPHAGIGLACGRYTVAFDIDVEDRQSVEIIRSMVANVCGETPLVRVGTAPKLALVYRSLEPIISIRLPKFDILGLGCQIVAYGDHPKTGKPYQWIGETAPHLSSLDQIPGVTNEQCVDVAAQVMRRIYGDRFERFVFDTDLDMVTLCLSSRKTLAHQLWARLIYGTRRARARFRTRVVGHEIPPGFWGFCMRPLVHGGFDHGDFLRRLTAGELERAESKLGKSDGR
jgi:hypothetical protein